jgi:hypothetical protein
VHSTRINIAGKPQLPYVSQPLKPRVAHKIKNKITGHRDKSIYRIVDDLVLVSQMPLNYFFKIINCPQNYFRKASHTKQLLNIHTLLHLLFKK